MKMKNKAKKYKRRNLLTVVALLILAFTAFGGAVIQMKTEKLCAEAEKLLSASEELALSGRFDDAETAAHELRKFWTEKSGYLGLFYEHSTSNRITEGIACLCISAGKESLVAFLTEAESLKEQFKVLSDYDRVTAMNII